MKLSRWIKFPLLFGILMMLPTLLVPDDMTLFSLLTRFVFGALGGLIIQAWSDSKARKRAGDNANEEIYEVRQRRSVTLLCDRLRAFELCENAIHKLENAVIKTANKHKGLIVGRTGVTWESFGTLITLNVAEINQNLVDVTIETRPIPRTARVDNGASWEIAERLSQLLRTSDAKLHDNLLEEGTEILMSATKRRFKPDAFMRNKGAESK